MLQIKTGYGVRQVHILSTIVLTKKWLNFDISEKNWEVFTANVLEMLLFVAHYKTFFKSPIILVQLFAKYI